MGLWVPHLLGNTGFQGLIIGEHPQLAFLMNTQVTKEAMACYHCSYGRTYLLEGLFDRSAALSRSTTQNKVSHLYA